MRSPTFAPFGKHTGALGVDAPTLSSRLGYIKKRSVVEYYTIQQSCPYMALRMPNPATSQVPALAPTLPAPRSTPYPRDAACIQPSHTTTTMSHPIAIANHT